jgi:hypothetical protein
VNELEQSRLAWRKSSRSGGQQECVELGSNDGAVFIRDSKQHGKGDVLRFSRGELGAFVQAVKDGRI